MSWWEYVQDVAGTTNQTEIARRTGLTQPSVNRWRTVSPKPANIRAFADAYGRPRLEAFVKAGLLTEEDVELTEIPATLAEVDIDDLLAEIRRRVKG